MPPDLNEVTNPKVAYLRLHGRDAKAYTTGKTVASRFNYNYSDQEITEVADRAVASNKVDGKPRRILQGEWPGLAW